MLKSVRGKNILPYQINMNYFNYYSNYNGINIPLLDVLWKSVVFF